MPFSPEQIEAKEFLSRLRGYDREEVRAFLRAVAEDYRAAQERARSLAVRHAVVPQENPPGTTVYLRQRPKVVSALNYVQSKGGTILMHGVTRQYSNVANPYDGQSANDFEFFRAHVDAANSVVHDGPVPESTSPAWATGRITTGLSEFARAGFARPGIFEFPHYAAGPNDYAAVRDLKVARKTQFKARYERGLYFKGALSGGTADTSRIFGQFFPYAVTDVYGSKVIPENLGNHEPEAFNNHPPRLPPDVVDTARRNLVVRDGFASFFYHPCLADACPVPKGTTPCIDDLKTIVEGIQALGYTFVTPDSVLSSP